MGSKSRRRKGPPPPPPRAPPSPAGVGPVIGFVVLLLAGIYIHYEYLEIIVLLSYLLFLSSMMCLALALYKAVDLYFTHRQEWPGRSRATVVSVSAVAVAGLVVGTFMFAAFEPYHEWRYEVELECTVGCVVELPVPLYEDGEAFFNAGDVRIEGQGQVEVVEKRYERKDTLALKVSWSGNLSLVASAREDYRPLPMGEKGFWNHTQDMPIVVGVEVPEDGDPIVRLSFEHDKAARYPKHEAWAFQGSVSGGVNLMALSR